MPIYEYRCTKCGHEMEALQGMNDRPLRKCPECKGKLERLQSAPAFQFKGSGWYVTDYGKSGGGSDPKSDSESSDSSDSKGTEKKKAASATSDGDSGGKKSRAKKTAGKK